MSLILGIDQSSSKTGMCLIDTAESLSTARLHSFATQGTSDQAKVESFSMQIDQILRDWKPEFVAIEEPLKHIQPHTKRVQTLHGVREEQTINAHTPLLLNMIAGALIRGLMGLKLPRTMVRPQTWRKSFLGYTTNKEREKHGHKTWKHAAVAQCERYGIPARNQDQAEAAGIAFWATSCDEWRLLRSKARAA